MSAASNVLALVDARLKFAYDTVYETFTAVCNEGSHRGQQTP
jgi:hypothetical protein